MSLQELQEFVQAQLAENPALSVGDEATCPVCGCELYGSCVTCGCAPAGAGDAPDPADDWPDEFRLPSEPQEDPVAEPFARVAAPVSLRDHLRQQVYCSFQKKDMQTALFLVDCLDDDGYLREPLFDIASRLGLSVPQLESVLDLVQSLDPPGVAARSLQECLLIQLRQLGCDSPDAESAFVLIGEHWDLILRMRLDEAAQRAGLTREDVESALKFVRENLNPYPASAFRDPWQELAPQTGARVAPDIVIRRTETGLVAEVVDAVSSHVSLDEAYASLSAHIARRANDAAPESVLQQVREQVQQARALLDALEFRKSAIKKVVDELLRCQHEFFAKGTPFLKPLTKKDLAALIGVHESTVCRATEGKMIRLPDGEVVPVDVLFDSALPVKEMVRRLAAERLNGRPLSDGQIAERLKAMGIEIARRTVAKYRSQMGVPSQDYRSLLAA